MDFSLTPELLALRDRTRSFIAEQIVPFETDRRRSGGFLFVPSSDCRTLEMYRGAVILGQMLHAIAANPKSMLEPASNNQ